MIIYFSSSINNEFSFLPFYGYPLVFMFQSMLWGFILFRFLDKPLYKLHKPEINFDISIEGKFFIFN